VAATGSAAVPVATMDAMNTHARKRRSPHIPDVLPCCITAPGKRENFPRLALLQVHSTLSQHQDGKHTPCAALFHALGSAEKAVNDLRVPSSIG